MEYRLTKIVNKQLQTRPARKLLSFFGINFQIFPEVFPEMYNPEVINFPAPKSLKQTYTWKKDQVLNKVPSQDLGNHFHGITAVLPGEITEIAEIQDFFLDSTFYRVNKFPVHKLLDPNFLSAFVKKGHFDARTLGTWGEVDQSIVVESGKLHLSVCKDVYQELGLSGQAEVISSKKCPAKYDISVNLLEDKFSPDSKYYKRVSWCLKNQTGLQFDWIMNWHPHNSDICPSSLAAYLDLLGFEVVQCLPSFKERICNQVKVPLLCTETDISDVVEWVGAAALNIECPDQENYTSSMTCPEPSYKSEKVHILKWKGFFSAREAKELLGVILKLRPEATENSVSSWLNLTLIGFDEFQIASSICSVFSTTSDICQVFTNQTSKRKIK